MKHVNTIPFGILIRFSFAGACITSTNGSDFVTINSKLEDIWYLCYEAKHDMNLSGAGDIYQNMAHADANFKTLVDENYKRTKSNYCFNTNNIQCID